MERAIALVHNGLPHSGPPPPPSPDFSQESQADLPVGGDLAEVAR